MLERAPPTLIAACPAREMAEDGEIKFPAPAPPEDVYEALKLFQGPPEEVGFETPYEEKLIVAGSDDIIDVRSVEDEVRSLGVLRDVDMMVCLSTRRRASESISSTLSVIALAEWTLAGLFGTELDI